jgi:prophage antirepressor-like protein
MNELQIFNSEEFGDIRTVTIDNEPWFVGKDVATALGYKNTADAIGKHIDTDDKLTSQIAIAGQRRDVVVINESGLYALIFGSKLDSAKRFKHWVTSEVLPTIRKTGSYQKPMTVAEQIQLLALGNQNHEERIEKLENTMTIDYGQQKYISDLVSKVVIEVLGGKKSNAYDEIGKKVFAECNRDVKTYFDVNARNNIPKLRYQEAVEYIKEWEPCMNTKMLIRDCNAQGRLAE